MHVSENDLELYVLGRLAEGQASSVKTHVLDCRECREKLTATGKFIEQFAELSHRQAQASGAEKRKEPRFATNDRAWLRVLRPLPGERMEALVLDVSKEGLKLSLTTRIDPGTVIEVRVGNMLAFGEIRYCVKAGESIHAGVHLNDVWITG